MNVATMDQPSSLRALVTGATGTLGPALLRRLTAPRVLARDPVRARVALGVRDVHGWDATRPVAPALLDGVDAVFHLAGEPVAGGRWTAERRARIRDSRVLGTRALVSAMRAAPVRPRVLVSASAVGFYGDRGDEVLDERSAGGAGFLADVCAEWEREACAAEELGVRVVRARIGVVLSPTGGALEHMLPPFRRGVGGPLGRGTQWMSWVHHEDVVSLLLHAASHADVHGALDVVAPEPATNAELSKALGRTLGRPTILRVPELALRAVLGDLAEVALASQRALPRAALASGFVFRFPHLEPALEDVLRPTSRAALAG